MSYWDRTLNQRLSRRRAIAVAAAAGVSAAILACGGDGDDAPAAASKDRSGLLTTVEDTRSKAKQGGIWSSYRTTDYVTFDPINSRGSNVGHTQLAYSVIVSYKPGSTAGNIGLNGEAAESWEISNDGTQVAFKLRPNVKLDSRAPTNGRTLTAEDWLYTWNAFTAKSPQAGELVSKLDPNAPIESWSSPDARTVVFKLQYPWAPFLPLLNHTRYGLVLVPVEHDGKYDTHQETRGSGPFMLTKNVASSTVEWRRNPNYWDAPRPYLDGIDLPILPEYATRIGQFKAGNIWDADIRAEDILNLKRENPKVNVWLNSNFTGSSQPLALNWRPNSPFHDFRVRKGLSLLYDRELFLRTFQNVDGFAKEGIDISYRLHTIVFAGDTNYWIDPLSNGLGAVAENIRYNPDEAAKLLNAAGIKGLELPFSVNRAATPAHQALVGMFNTGGFFNFKVDPVEPALYASTIFQPKGNIGGVAPLSNGAGIDPDLALTRYYATSQYSMYTGPVPYDDLLRKQQRELNIERRKDLWKQIQIKWAETLTPDLTGTLPGVSDTLETAQPWLANRGALTGPLGNTFNDISLTKQYWYDETKRT